MTDFSVSESTNLVQKVLEVEEQLTREDHQITQQEDQIKKQRSEHNDKRDKHRAHANNVKASLTKQKDALRKKRAEDANLLSAVIDDEEYEALLARLTTLAAESKEVARLIEKLDVVVGNASTSTPTPALSQLPHGHKPDAQTGSKKHYAPEVANQQDSKLKGTAATALQTLNSRNPDQEDALKSESARQTSHFENTATLGTIVDQTRSVGLDKATQPCRTCAVYRNRCDLLLPTCGTCQRVGLSCQGYDLQTQDDGVTSQADSQTPAIALQSNSKKPLAKSTAKPQYRVQDMSPCFPGPGVGNAYSHIIVYGGKVFELNCPICGTNSMSGGKYFNGAECLVKHVRRAHLKDNLKSEQEIFEAAAANGRLREVSEADINRISKGEQPEDVRMPDRGLNQKSSDIATQDEEYQTRVSVLDSGRNTSNTTSSSFAALPNTSADFSTSTFSKKAIGSGLGVSAHDDGLDVPTSRTSRPRRNKGKRAADDGSLRGMAAINAIVNAEKEMEDMAIDSQSQGEGTGASRKRRKKGDDSRGN